MRNGLDGSGQKFSVREIGGKTGLEPDTIRRSMRWGLRKMFEKGVLTAS